MPHISPKCCCGPGICDVEGQWYLTISYLGVGDRNGYANAARCYQYPGHPDGAFFATPADYWYFWDASDLHTVLNSVVSEPFTISASDANPSSWLYHQLKFLLSGLSATATLYVASGTTTKPPAFNFVPYDFTFDEFEAYVQVYKSAPYWYLGTAAVFCDITTSLAIGNMTTDYDWTYEQSGPGSGWRYVFTKQMPMFCAASRYSAPICQVPLENTITNRFQDLGDLPSVVYANLGIHATSLSGLPTFKWPFGLAGTLPSFGDPTLWPVSIDKSP